MRPVRILPTAAALVVAGCFAGGAPMAAQGTAGGLIEGAGELLDRGKAAVGLGPENPQGRTLTGVSGGVPFLVRFRGTVGGLEPGDPVEVRGMRMGAVREVRVTFDPAAEDFDIPVVIELDPAPFVGGERGADEARPRVEAAVAALVRRGLRARVGTRNLATGERLIRLDAAPGEAPGEMGRGGDGGMAEIPATSAAGASPAALADTLLGLATPEALARTADDLAAIVGTARRLADDPAVRELPPRLAQLARGGTAAMADANRLLARSRGLPRLLEELVEQATAVARSARSLVDTLERQPGALIRGKATGGP